MTSGIVSSWGDNPLGMLGNGSTSARVTPGEVTGLKGVVGIAAGTGHAIALQDDGTAWAWGRNTFGQLGDGTKTHQNLPVQVLTGVVKVDCAGGHSIALREDGTVWAWGFGVFGTLGSGAMTIQPTPVQVVGIDRVTDIASSGAHNIAVRDDGTLWTWGRDNQLQLGERGALKPDPIEVSYFGNSIVACPTPAPVEGLEGVKGVGAGGGHTFAILADGSLLVWGFNDCGQLGDGLTADRGTPRLVEGLPAGVVSASGAYHNSVVALTDGTVWAWGLNEGGQVGDGTTAVRTTPTQVVGLSDVVKVSTNGGGTPTFPGGGGHSLALSSDGTLWAWGHNDYGQLGDGTTTDRLTPVRVPDLDGVTAIACGGELPPSNTFGGEPFGAFSIAVQ
jgi:alpha-tubulin suppressor-like RCC1 family protein